MNRICFALLAAVACQGQPDPGTQIGVENHNCQGISSAPWTDAVTAPDGFDRSINDILAQVVGSFSGPSLDGAGAPTGDTLALDVATGEGDIMLLRREPMVGIGDPGTPASCPDALVFPLELSLIHPDFAWAGLAELQVTASGDMSVRADLSNEDALAFPAPTTFDRDADYTWFSLDLTVDEDQWQVEGVWHFENAEFERGNGGDAYVTETVLAAEMSP